MEENGWSDLSLARTRDGLATLTLMPSRTMTVRFALASGEISRSLVIRVRTFDPTEVRVDWAPSSGGILKVTARIVTSQGVRWTGRTQLWFQFRASYASSWKTLDVATTMRGQASLSTTRLATGTYRVLSREFNLSSERAFRVTG
jgi:hypothetical protein